MGRSTHSVSTVAQLGPRPDVSDTEEDMAGGSIILCLEEEPQEVIDPSMTVTPVGGEATPEDIPLHQSSRTTVGFHSNPYRLPQAVTDRSERPSNAECMVYLVLSRCAFFYFLLACHRLISLLYGHLEC